MLIFATFVLFSFPLLSMFLFLRFGTQQGIVWTVLLGFLFLPLYPRYDLPLLPVIDRHNVYMLCAVVFAFVASKGRGRRLAGVESSLPTNWLPRSKLAIALICFTLFTPIATILTNSDAGPSRFGFLVPVAYTDIGGLFYEFALPVMLFLVARRFLSDEQGMITILKAVGFCGVIYGALIFVEWRLSPMLKFWVYGIWDINWSFVMRGTGFRPVIFMSNPLQTAIFQAMACVSAVAVFRSSTGGDRTLWRMISLINLACLPFTLSMAAIVIGFGMSLFAFIGSKKQILAILALAGAFAFTYPLLRTAEVVPTGAILAVAGQISEDRRASLATRFRSEDLYIERTLDRPLFGWAQRQRDMPRNEKDEPIAIPDSFFIIVLAQRGLVSFIGIFGLFTLPLIMLWRRRRTAPIGHVILGLGLMVTVSVADKLLNSFFTPLLFLASGAIMGLTERVVFREADEAARARRAALEVERSKWRGRKGLGQSQGGALNARRPGTPGVQGGHALARPRR
ncbi:MAG: hypothetical protein AAF371_10455 [Pseudomonadota bacterium]